MSELVPAGERSILRRGEKVEEFLSLSVEEEIVGIPLKKILTISKTLDIVEVPFTPHYMVGIINLRGEIIPIFSLKSLLGLSETKEPTRIVTLDTLHGKAGVLVDSIRGVIRLEEKQLEPNPMVGRYSAYVRNVAHIEGGLISILDIDKIFDTIVEH